MACAAASDACAVSPGFHARAVGDYDGRRRQAPRPRRVRSHKACIKQVSKPQCRRTPTTTHHPARAYQCTVRSARVAPGRADGRGNAATIPAVQTASMGVIPDPHLASWSEMCAIGRAFVVRQSTPHHKVLRAHKRQVQGDGSRLPWAPLAAGQHPNRCRPPSPMFRHTAREPHVGQVGVRTTGGPRAPRIHRFVAILQMVLRSGRVSHNMAVILKKCSGTSEV